MAPSEPFRGTHLPLRRYGHDPRVQSVMLEIRRDVGLDSSTAREQDVAKLRCRLRQLVLVAGSVSAAPAAGRLASIADTRPPDASGVGVDLAALPRYCPARTGPSV